MQTISFQVYTRILLLDMIRDKAQIWAVANSTSHGLNRMHYFFPRLHGSNIELCTFCQIYHFQKRQLKLDRIFLYKIIKLYSSASIANDIALVIFGYISVNFQQIRA